ncbi:MAG: hypothetical protein J0H49_28960 [Acidobacteria bacterium]|nr:hypothetical protein [Acidobacteriota bacterium]
MVERIDIERALDSLASDEGGFIFQGLAVVLAKLRWPELIASERHKDRGLDAYASASVSADGRGKGLACSITGTYEKIKDDATETKKHYPDVSLLIFYTSEKVSQGKKAEWAQKIHSDFGLELIVVSREDIITTLQLPGNAHLCATHLRIPVPFQQTSAPLLQRVRDATGTVATQWAAHPRLTGKPTILLNGVIVDRKGNETRQLLNTAHLHAQLLQGRRLILEAPAGRGKTTTLIQLARMAGSPPPFAFLVDLPGWVRSPATILEHIARTPAFLAHGIDAAALAQLSQTEPCLFLLNGWNEISSVYSQEAATALHELERTFPAAGIVVATRVHDTVPPLPGSTRIRLLPLTAAQRLQYLVEALGETQARQFHESLAADRVLNELTRTPLILSEITALHQSGREVPRTKLRLLRAVIEMMEQSEAHSAHLQGPPLWGHAEQYLRELALQLVGRGDVIIGAADARSVCHTVSDRLKHDQQLEHSPESADILKTLCAHHILERIEYPVAGFRFEHQQFQEYYAALMVQEKLAELVAEKDANRREAFNATYINEPAWDEPLALAAEDFGSTGDHATSVESASVLIDGALRVDPLFAARLARLCGPAHSQQLRSELGKRLRLLYAADNPHYRQLAIAAMLATGWDDFIDILIPLLIHSDQQIRLGTYRAGSDFYPSCLGANWWHVVSGWQERFRGEFVSELALHHGRTEVALAFARSDPSVTVKIEAVRLLAWMGQYPDVAGLLQAMNDSEFRQMVTRLELEEIPSHLHSRARAAYTALLAETSDPKTRFQITLTLGRLGHSNGSNLLKDELAVMPGSVVKELSDYSLRPAIEAVRTVDSPWVSQWVADRIVEGALWRDSWLAMVSTLPEGQREALLLRVTGENLQYGATGRIVSLLAATSDPTFAKRVFEALCSHRQQLLDDPRNTDKQAIDQQLRGLFKSTPVQRVVEGLSDMLAKTPSGLELSLMLEMFSRMGSTEDSVRGALPDPLRQQLRRYFKAAVPAVLKEEDNRGEAKGRLATALAEVGDSEDVTDLLILIHADIQRVRDGRAALARGDRSRRGQGGMMSYSNWHVQALVWLDQIKAPSILIDLLKEAEYELDAAWGLVTLAKKDAGDHPIVTGRFGSPARDYRKFRQAPLEWSTLYDEERRTNFAAALKERITALLDESRLGDHKSIPYHYRLKELGKALASLDPKDSADLVLEIAALPADWDGWRRFELLESLLFGGVELPADKVINLLEPVFGQFRKQGIYNNDSLSLFNRILHMLPFLKPPSLGIAKVRELSAEFRLHLQNHEGLLMALGQCGCDEGLELLCELASQSGAAFQHIARVWFDAVAACPLPQAKELLLGFVDPQSSGGIGELEFPDHMADYLASVLAKIANSDSAVSARLLELAEQTTYPRGRQILAKVLPQLDAPQSLLAALNLLDDGASQPVPYEVWRSLEDVFLEKRPYKDTQSYTLVPRAANDLKKRLFEMAEGDSRRTRAAYTLLAQIEEWRLEHGRPSSEPRHPAYASGVPWPPVPVRDKD